MSETSKLRGLRIDVVYRARAYLNATGPIEKRAREESLRRAVDAHDREWVDMVIARAKADTSP